MIVETAVSAAMIKKIAYTTSLAIGASVEVGYIINRKRRESLREIIRNSVLLEVKQNINYKYNRNDIKRVLEQLHIVEPWYRTVLEVPRYFSFIIYARHGKISFHIFTPREFEKYIERKLYSQYPVEIARVNGDYSPTFRERQTFAGYMLLQRKFSKPLNVSHSIIHDIIAAMSGLNKNEEMMVDITLIPINNTWQGIAYRDYRDLLFNGRNPDENKYARQLKDIIAQEAIYNFRVLTKKPKGEIKQKNTPVEKEELRLMADKLKLPGFNAIIRIMSASPIPLEGEMRLKALARVFSRLDGENSLRFVPAGHKKKFIDDVLKHRINHLGNGKTILNIDELACLFDFVSQGADELSVTKIKTYQINSYLLEPAQGETWKNKGIMIGNGIYRNQKMPVYISHKKEDINDAINNILITGKKGAGKTILLIGIMLQLAEMNYPIVLIDSQQDTIRRFLESLDKKHWDRVVYMNFADLDYPIPLDLFRFDKLNDFTKDMVNSHRTAWFKRKYGSNWGPATQYLVTHSIYTLMEVGGGFIEMLQMFTDTAFREATMEKIKDKQPLTWMFWQNFNSLSPQQRLRSALPSINKINPFVSASMLRNIFCVGQQKFTFSDFRKNRNIVLINVAKYPFSGELYKLLGSLLYSDIWLDIVSQMNTKEEERITFFAGVDEFRDFVLDTFSETFSQGRRFRLCNILGVQHLDQIKRESPEVYTDILGSQPNVFAMLSGEDGELWEQHFTPYYDRRDIEKLEPHHAISRISVKKKLSDPFLMETIEPERINNDKDILDVIHMSRKKIAIPKREADRIVNERLSQLRQETIEALEETINATEAYNELSEEVIDQLMRGMN